MATWDDVIAIGERFPGVEVTTSWGRPALKAAGKFMCSIREDPDAFVFRVLDVPDQQALVQGEPDVFFTTPHYDGWPYVLVRLTPSASSSSRRWSRTRGGFARPRSWSRSTKRLEVPPGSSLRRSSSPSRSLRHG